MFQLTNYLDDNIIIACARINIIEENNHHVRQGLCRVPLIVEGEKIDQDDYLYRMIKRYEETNSVPLNTWQDNLVFPKLAEQLKVNYEIDFIVDKCPFTKAIVSFN